MPRFSPRALLALFVCFMSRAAFAQLPGDMNDDCRVTGSDIALFVDVLLGVEIDEAMIAAADIDENAIADARDIPGFLAQLVEMAACPMCTSSASGFAGGSGTAVDPYEICNAAQLQRADDFLNAHFVLTADIDLAGVTWTPIGFTTFGDSIVHYNATFNGAGHRVRNLTLQQSNTDVIGLFGKLGPNAVVTDLGIENVIVQGKLCVGAFAAENDGIIRRCYVRGGSVTGATFVGGMIGDNRNLMEDCYAQIAVVGSTTVGGLAGVSFTSPVYMRCYSTGSVSGSSTVGGLIGNVLGTHTVSNCYWDTQTSGRPTSAGGIGRTTAQMMQQATFAGWNFVTTWTMPVGDYPRLAWE